MSARIAMRRTFPWEGHFVQPSMFGEREPCNNSLVCAASPEVNEADKAVVYMYTKAAHVTARKMLKLPQKRNL